MKFLLPQLLLFSFSIVAQNSYIPVERTFTTKEGLSSDKIHTLHKDSQGFIWIGTEKGLDRFDGQNFKHFNKKAYPKMTLDRVQFIAEDTDGYLWLVEKHQPFEHYFTKPKFNFYNIHTGKWSTVEERFGQQISTDFKKTSFIKQFEDGAIFLYLASLKKAYSFQQGQFQAYTFPKEFFRVSDVKVRKNGHLVLEATLDNFIRDRYVFEINKQGQIVNKIETNIPFIAQTNETQYPFQLNARDNLIGGQNLDAFDIFYPNHQPPKSTFNRPIQIEQSKWNEDKQLLWLKNESNFYVLQSNGNMVYQKTIPQDPHEMPILFDGHITWYSDKQNGLVALTLQPNYFQSYQQFNEGFDNSARGIYADKKGNIWISTIGGVLHKSVKATTFQFENTLMFTTFMKDNNHQLWSFRERAFENYHLSTGQKNKFPYNTDFHINSWAMYQADNGDIWTYGNGGHHYVFNPTTGETKLERKLPIHSAAFYVYDIQKKDGQLVWLATNQGLYIVDNQGDFVARYNKNQKSDFYLPTNDIHHLYQDKNGTIWLATGDNGLLWLTVNGERLTVKNHFTTENGLNCDILHSVYEDDYEYLWLSSNEGLMQLDKRTEKVVTYTTENGLLHNEFNRIAHFKAEDGTLWLGGLTGVINFHPKHFSSVRYNGRQSPLVVTNFQQFSAKKERFENLTNALTQTNQIRLQHNDRFFRLNVALLNYQDDATFQYRIKGFYDWQAIKDSELNISGLPYGKHVLEIKGFNANQIEAANTLNFTVHVLRPFYLQWWFLLIALSGLGAAIFYFMKWRTQQLLVVQETEQLRRLDTMKSQFFANISHELRTPITLILAPLTQLIKNHRNQSADVTEKELLHIRHNGKALLKLVNEVLDLSKLESNKLKLDLSSIKIPDFLERVVMNFESTAKIKNIEYQFISFLDKTLMVKVDQVKLEKIVNNLLSNALKFTPSNGTIQIIVARVDNQLIIKVRDSGKGVAVEDLPHIFERYFQSKYKQMTGGTGIGLALTKELVELMNGEISVESKLDKGTEFTVKLPIVLIENEELLSESEIPTYSGKIENEINKNLNISPKVTGYIYSSLPQTSPTPNKKKETILLVEDNLPLQEFIQSVLTPFYNVQIANNGVEALNWLATNYQSPIANHLILSDVMMPEMDGFTLLEKVKADNRFCSIPFVLLTARADINDKLKGLRIGVDDYMTKPFEVEELLLRIKNLMANIKNRQFSVESLSQELELSNKQLVANGRQLAVTKKTSSKATVNRQPSTVDLEWLEEVEKLVQKELKNSQLSVDFLANKLFLSQRQLYRKLKKITGMTPHQYIKNCRLQIAKRILETEDVYTLTEVCNAVGLENTTHFAKAYEKMFGKRPHSLLKKHQ